MSMDQTGAPEGGTTQAGEPTQTQAPSTESQGGAAQQGNTNQGAEPEVFDRPYVEGLRRENAGYRTRAKAYEDAFSAYTPEQQEVLLRMVRGLGDPNEQAKTAAEWKDIAERILNAETPVGPTGEEDPDAQPITRRDWKQMEAQRQHEAMVQHIVAEAGELGFPEFVQGPNGPEPNIRYSMLLHAAQRPEIAGDLKKAAEHVQQYERSVVDTHAKHLQENGEKWPPTTGTAGNTGAQEPQERPNYKDARKGALAWLASKAGQA